MILNVFLLWEANNQTIVPTIDASLSPGGTDTLLPPVLLVLSPYSTMGSSFVRCCLSHDPLCGTVHCCPQKTVQKHGKVKWHAVSLSVEFVLQVGGKVWIWVCYKQNSSELRFNIIELQLEWSFNVTL